MSKVDLKASSGLPIFLDNSSVVGIEPLETKTVNYSCLNLREQLLNSEIENSEIFYTKYCNIFDNEIEDVRIDCYVVNPCLAGIEYSKTNALISEESTILEIVYGGGILLIQDFTSLQENIYYVTLKKGLKVLVPKGWQYSISNTKSTPLVALTFTTKASPCKNTLDDMSGMAYYVIRKNAKHEVVKNPKYKFVNDIKKLNTEKILKKYNISSKLPVLTQFKRKYEKLYKIFSSTVSI